MKKIKRSEISGELFYPEGKIFSTALRYKNKYLGWTINELLPNNTIKLWFIYIRKEYRRRGLCGELIKSLKAAHERVITNAYSITDDSTKALIKNGFKYIKSIHKKQEDILEWTKKPKEK